MRSRHPLASIFSVNFLENGRPRENCIFRYFLFIFFFEETLNHRNFYESGYRGTLRNDLSCVSSCVSIIEDVCWYPLVSSTRRLTSCLKMVLVVSTRYIFVVEQMIDICSSIYRMLLTLELSMINALVFVSDRTRIFEVR